MLAVAYFHSIKRNPHTTHIVLTIVINNSKTN